MDMKGLKSVLFSVFSLFVVFESLSQVSVLERPADFVLLTDDIKINYKADSEGSGLDWVVFSAKDNNPTYLTSDAREVKRYASFLEKLYIVDVVGRYAHVYKDERLGLDGVFSTAAVDYGWIELKQLVLTPNSLVTGNKIARKGMVLNTSGSLMKSGSVVDNAEFVNYYLDPELSMKTGDQTKIFQIFYIYKIFYKSGSPFSYLVGIGDRVGDVSDNNVVKTTIKGWIPAERVVNWDTRIAVEPNFEGVAAEERLAKGIKTSVFNSYDMCVRFQQGEPVSDKFIAWDSDSYLERKNGEWIRFPLISEDNNIYSLGVMGSLEDLKGNELLTTEENADIRAVTGQTSTQLRTINILFVVDGTSSMQQYFQSSIVPAINQIAVTLIENQKLNSFNFGALVYRDADEGDRLTETIPLTPNYDEVMDRLKAVKAIDIADLSAGEALYKGVYEGFRGVLNRDDETNVVIIIGDAGNREDARTHVDEEKLVNLIYKRDANVVCFQVKNSDNAAYDDFKTQTMRILERVAQMHEDDSKANMKEAGMKASDLQVVKGGDNSYVWDGSRYFEALYANKGEEKATSDLKKAIVRAIENANTRTNDLITVRNLVLEEGMDATKAIQKVTELSSGGTAQSDALGKGLIKMLKDAGLTNDQIKNAIQEKVQIYAEGYSPVSTTSLTHPLYKRVLLYSAEEFTGLFHNLNKLSQARGKDHQRKLLHDAWVEILDGYLGDIDKSKLEKMNLADIHQMVFGLPGANGLIKELKLNEILDEEKVTDFDIKKYASDIARKSSKLGSIINSESYPYEFLTNNVKYYWIEEDMIP